MDDSAQPASVRPPLLPSAGLGAASAAAVASLTLLADRIAGLPFLPFDLFDWLARALPGSLITLGIDTIVAGVRLLNLGPTDSTAKLIEQAMAVGLFLGIGAVLGVALALLARARAESLATLGLLAGLVLLIGFYLIERALGFSTAGSSASTLFLLLLCLGWGGGLGWLLARIPADDPGEPAAGLTRRQFLRLSGGGLLTISIGSLGLAELLEGDPAVVELPGPGTDAGMGATSGPAASPPEDVLAARLTPVPGTRAELTANTDFYRIDINTRPVVVESDTWALKLEGLVQRPLELTLDELKQRTVQGQVVTMQCISNPIGGDLTSTSLWSGVRLKDLLEEAGLKSEAREIYIESADGFYESVPLTDALDERTLLVHTMNGEPLPEEHGFPLRIYIPNRYGMKQPKWITRMEVIAEEGPGYWVDRGWSAEAIPHTTSVIDTASAENLDVAANTLPIGGIAWAGARGISSVEVQVDDGPWQPAELRAPPLSPLSWVQWRFEWPFSPGRHDFRVRAYDGSGELQTIENSDARPDGATGVHSVAVRF